jgi:hypothetical protein
MLIGSHDSTAYTLDLSVPFEGGKWQKLRIAGRIVPCVKKRIKSMTLTQSKSIREQYEAGIRVFDIRLAYSNGEFWCCHTFATISFYSFLKQVEGRDDIIILIRPDFCSGLTVNGHEHILMDILSELKCTVYYDPLDPAKITNWAPNVLNMNKLSGVWFNSQTVDDFKKDYLNHKFTPKDVLNGALTPSEDVSFKNLFCVTLRRYASELQPFIDNTVLPEKKPFVLLYDFIWGAGCHKVRGGGGSAGRREAIYALIKE